MSRISNGKLAKLFGRLATSYRAGIDVRAILERESKSGSPAQRVQLKKVYDQISQGAPLASAMQSTDGYFPELAISVIEAGEQGGRLDEAFSRLGDHYKTLVTFRNRFLQSIAWPCFELVMSIGVIALMMILMEWLVPDPPDWFRLGLSPRGNLYLFLGAVLLFFGGGFLLIYGIGQGWFGILPMKVARRIPLVGKTIEALSLSRFAWTMSVAENAGMDAVATSRLALNATENYYYKRLEPFVTKNIQAGNGFFPVLQATDSFPDEFLTYVHTGETAGELAESMNRASEHLQAQAENNLQTIGKIGFFLVFILIAVLIGGAIITLYQQYINQLNSFM